MLTLDKRKRKKAVSEIVAYVLLITIAISLSGMVYAWLRWYITPGQEIKCDSGTTLIIKDYKYTWGLSASLNITLQNKGLFKIDGFIISVNDRPGRTVGVYTLKINGLDAYQPVEGFSPGTEVSLNLDTSVDYDNNPLDCLTYIEVQPFVVQDNHRVVCGDLAKQALTCA